MPSRPHAADEVHVPRSETFELRSTETGLIYQIFTWVPDGEVPPAGFPVSYVLDGNSDFLTVLETVRRTSRMPDATGITPSIVVAVGYPNTTDYNVVRRGYDFTRRGPVDSDLDDNGFVYGGQPAFMRFIERQLVPYIGAHYPAHINSRTLIGHSLGGYCALEFLAWKPSVFKGYIILSPSIWWDKPGLWERLLHPRLGEVTLRIYFAVGRKEEPVAPNDATSVPETNTPRSDRRMVSNVQELAADLRKMLNDRSGVKCDVGDEEDHATVVPTFLSRGLRFARAP